MAVYRTACPHCGTAHVAFESIQEWGILGESQRRGLFICGNCSEGIIVAFLPGLGVLSQIRDLDSGNIFVLRVWPQPLSTDAPEATPERPALYYKQAYESFVGGHYDAAGMMFRKCLESATKELGQTSPDSLVKRIDALAASHLITLDMKSWAHQIRLGGNEAAHEDDPFTKDEAERLSLFCNAFLKYAFTFPAVVAAGKN